MSDDGGGGGCGCFMLFIILIMVAVMCSRQAKELGYHDEEELETNYEEIEMYDAHDSLIYHYEK